MQRPTRARRGRSPPLSWPALVAVAAMHGALVAALAATLHDHRAPPPSAQVTNVALLLEHASASAAPMPAPQLASVRAPALAPPAIVIATDAEGVAIARPVVAIPTRAAAPSRDDRLRRYAALLWSSIAAHKRAGLHRAGTVTLRFQLDTSGRLVALAVARSSGDAMLDAAALMAVRAAAPFVPPPPGLAPADLAFTLPFEFS